MKLLVTGAAGFIGSNLCRRLLTQSHSVIGVDSYTDFYPRWIKERNTQQLTGHSAFEFLPQDLNDLDLNRLLSKVEGVFHLAAQAGVRTSWGRDFDIYVQNNILNTQRLLEASKEASLKKFVFASSSSVYGLTRDLPMKETSALNPFSPYGVTKLAAEKLCSLYHVNHGVPSIALRFFTVFGPGQRPDMAFHRFFKAVLEDTEIPVYGDGTQTRDFTYVDDAVGACLSALERGRPGEAYNVGGGHREKLAEILPLFEEVCQKPVRTKNTERQKGDVPDTQAHIDKARTDLGYEPRTDLKEGLTQEWEWINTLYRQ